MQGQRTSIPEKERKLRSQITKLMGTAEGFLHGTFIEMSRVCGNPNCKCVLKKEKHKSWYLGQTIKGKTRMFYLKKSQEQKARKYASNFEQVREMLEQISAERCIKFFQKVSNNKKKR